ncbi:outer membrane protein OmpA-like peptidoglycan-associated protein [Panacagrimonas perspica]|uniref:Outer membrane protein OmpA-like peptidoglycan-associated protein n=1 Tax=Panacagrimonas perspica TaxID=381431 RepID=A0A4R7PAH0_9GAMM|nr:OmpA family protein [Panacagrimonas perspica]TDU30898.1 outer membrane protein OmpA-like peptidoglycan-associated protein [Panacagrimonas perspica]
MKLRAALLVVLLAGCATHDRVILLPNSDGGVGKIAILRDGQETVIGEPYASANTDDRGHLDSAILEAADVRKEFDAELAGLPARPVTRNLYFRADSTLLTAESEAEATAIFNELAARSAVEIVLVGHSDTQGSERHNDQLSLTRAMLVRARLIATGISAFNISVAGMGERSPIVPTPDGVDEPRNRRVELHAR